MTPERLQQFWERVKKTEGCWAWTGSKAWGYGILGTGAGERVRAHRLSWEIHNGEIPPHRHVLHRCDNKACVRPDHLYLGSHADNMQDAVERGQFPSGDRNGMRLLAKVKRLEKERDSLISALREAQGHPLSGEVYGLRDVVERLEKERDDLLTALREAQRRVETLEEALLDTLQEVHANFGCDPQCEKVRHATLRGSCPTCGEAMDGIQHGKSECNVDLRGGETG